MQVSRQRLAAVWEQRQPFMNIVLLSTDLMLSSAAQGIVDRAGASLTMAADGADAIAACQNGPAASLVIDLRMPGLDLPVLVSNCRKASPGAEILAFGPHVHTHSLAAAAAAGCDDVFTRGEFDRRLAALVSELTARQADREDRRRV